MRRLVMAAVLVLGLGAGITACGDSGSNAGEQPELNELEAKVSQLRLEVENLRQEVASLRDEVANPPTTSTTAPGTTATTVPRSTTSTTRA
jgi:hypothetical protein